MSSPKRCDYMLACADAMWGKKWRINTKRVLRKLVREAAYHAACETWSGLDKYQAVSCKQIAERIAKGLIP